jgi:hypothetical protein
MPQEQFASNVDSDQALSHGQRQSAITYRTVKGDYLWIQSFNGWVRGLAPRTQLIRGPADYLRFLRRRTVMSPAIAKAEAAGSGTLVGNASP